MVQSLTPRFQVHELGGWAIREDLQGHHAARSNSGLTVTVLDSAYCYRVVATWRSEENVFTRDAWGRWYAHSRAARFANIRQEAQALANKLNEALE